MHFTRESIFVTSVRTFCTCFSAIIGIVIGISLVMAGLSFISGPDIYPEKSSLLISPDANGSRELLPHSAPVILRLNINDVIGTGELTAAKFQNLLLDAQEGMLAPHRVHGIMLYVNSPGGDADESAVIYRMLKTYKEKYKLPIYAFVDGLCASGAMYISCAADKIFASPSSIVGSVGVIMSPAFNFSKLMQQYGVDALTLTQGKDKDMLNPYRPWQPGEDNSLRRIMEVLYDDFVSTVVANRPQMDREKLINEYGAQVYVSTEAAQKGYIDVAGVSYEQALTELVQTAQIANNQAYQVFQLTPPHSFLSDLTGGAQWLFRGKITHSFPIAPFITSELSGRFLYLYQPPIQAL